MADGSEGFRLKTIRLRQQLSQGLLLPLTILNLIQVEEGMDVTELLGITKWEPPMPASLAGVAKGLFPSFLTKTDEERCLSQDTIVITENGQKTIKDIVDTKYFGKVLSYNTINNTDEWNYINSHSVVNNNSDWYEIELESGKILKATGNHRIWIADLMCYREVRELIGNETVKITE
jgi:hypothetical protein